MLNPHHIADQIRVVADEDTMAIMLSRVYFKSGLINQHISEIAEVARSKNIPFLIDDYHGTNVAPLSLQEQNLEDCYLLIGGYKYLQWGEGNRFLRFRRTVICVRLLPDGLLPSARSISPEQADALNLTRAISDLPAAPTIHHLSSGQPRW
ncbi:MAG: hypothetical protein U5K69_02555 [Balneolaceae bacterium]|nr:hypothetical protein [Balneolaceae bacterium]